MQYFLNCKENYCAIDNHYGSVSNKRCIDGRITGSNKCVGFCNYAGHPGYVTSEIARKHQCFEKGCGYFIQKTHAVYRSPVKKDNAAYREIVEFVCEQSKSFEGLKILDNKTRDNKIIFYYVTVSNDYRFDRIVQNIGKDTFGFEIDFQRIPCDYSDAVSMIFGMEMAV